MSSNPPTFATIIDFGLRTRKYGSAGKQDAAVLLEIAQSLSDCKFAWDFASSTGEKENTLADYVSG